MSNLGIRNNNQLSLPQTPLKPSKSLMPKETPTVKTPTIRSTSSQTSVTDSQSVLSQVQTIENKSLNTTQKVLDVNVSLSDISGEITAKAKLKNAFKSLKELFSPSTNKLKFEMTAANNKRLRVDTKDLFLMKYNPIASSKDKQLSRDFDAFTYKEFSNENTEFLKFSRKLVSMGTDHPNFDKHMKTAMKHYVLQYSTKEVNVSYKIRGHVTKAYDKYLQNPSTENKANLITAFNNTIKATYKTMDDTNARFSSEHKNFSKNVKETKQGRLWRNFKSDHKKWWNNRAKNPFKSSKQDFVNFFKSWGSFSKATANIFFMQAMPETQVSNKYHIAGKSKVISGSTNDVREAKKAYAEAHAFNSGKTTPKYSDYNL